MVLVNLHFNMNILLKNATVLEPSSPYHSKTVDIIIQDGKIKDISDSINTSAELIISKKNLHVSPDGLIPVFVSENLVSKKERQ